MIKLTKVAENNLNEISKLYTAKDGQQSATLLMRRLFAEMRVLANNPHIGLPDPRYNLEFKSWQILDGQYYVFFKRPNVNTLRVAMIRSTSEPMPTLAELRKATK
jgi:plasmid stabilization system protein ParE